MKSSPCSLESRLPPDLASGEHRALSEGDATDDRVGILPQPSAPLSSGEYITHHAVAGAAGSGLQDSELP